MDIEIKDKNIYLKNKIISKLDMFVVDFIDILKKYTLLLAVMSQFFLEGREELKISTY